MEDFVELTGILLDIRYATPHNFTGKAVYSSSRCFLRRKTAERLYRVESALKKQGLGLKVYDGYRPRYVQQIFWDLMPNSLYVADPKVGSCHNRGASVDLTLVNDRGEELLMPTEFDDFTEKASHDYRGGSKVALENRALLKKAMMAEGFIPYPNEWWHYDDPEWEQYPLVDFRIEDLPPG